MQARIEINNTQYLIDKDTVSYTRNGKTRMWSINEFLRFKGNTKKHSVAVAVIKLKEWDK